MLADLIMIMSCFHNKHYKNGLIKSTLSIIKPWWRPNSRIHTACIVSHDVSLPNLCDTHSQWTVGKDYLEQLAYIVGLCPHSRAVTQGYLMFISSLKNSNQHLLVYIYIYTVHIVMGRMLYTIANWIILYVIEYWWIHYFACCTGSVGDTVALCWWCMHTFLHETSKEFNVRAVFSHSSCESVFVHANYYVRLCNM